MHVVNRLLETLPRTTRDRFLGECEPVSLAFGTVLCERDRPYGHAYFPLGGFVSLVAKVGSHPPLEIALIGNEGMLGATLVLGVNTARLQGIVQGAGTAWRMPAARFRRALRESPALREVTRSYLYVVLTQLSQSTACTRFHEAESRLARWLLMTHDRAHADRLHLTHQYLGDMLGVRRSAITIAAGALQRRKLIRYVRGTIEVVDRKGLEAASCECYRTAIGDYERMFD
ncbi:MAG TPA: Crp/Fnr family transcriptional regulator [Steroidobacteraceae bacterium]|nr:Crp/Fnr family transcriptional regulator [Steroidobacteraceae bacterium]